MSEILNRRKDEDIKAYLIRIYSNMNKYGLTRESAADLMNKATGKTHDESKWRKDYAQYVKWRDHIQQHDLDDTILDKLTEKKLEIQKERVKLQTVRKDVNKWVTETSRSELIFEEFLNTLHQESFPPARKLDLTNSEKESAWVVSIADCHYGKIVRILGLEGEVIAEYNTEIFEDRMWLLAGEIIKLAKKENIKKFIVLNLADSVEGLLRMTQLATLKYGVIQQTIRFAKFMARWLDEVSKTGEIALEYYSNLGNHDELRLLNNGRGDLPEENVGYMIDTILELALIKNPNVTIRPSKHLQYLDIVGTKVLTTHGQNEKKLENSIRSYRDMYNKPIHMLITGHLHSLEVKTIGKDGSMAVEYYQCPSVCGIDEYSVHLKKVAPAGATIFKFERGKGRVFTYDVRLD